jgi:arylsulfatase A-like enzyme
VEPKKMEARTCCSLLLLSVLLAGVMTTHALAQPNILFLLADDMGQWAAGTYGNPEIFTPNIDRLALEGLKFNNAFCNTPVCSASRTTYFTGRLPSQNGVHDWISGGNGCVDRGIDYTRYEVAYSDVLAAHSYTCAISGKYHLGDQQQMQHSFKHWFVHQKGGASYINPPMVKELQCVNIDGYVTDIITDDAINFMTDYVKSGSKDPFYLSVHYTAPHSPYVGGDGKADSMHPPEIVNLYDDAKFVSCPQEPKNSYAKDWNEALTNDCLGNRECLKGYYAAVTAMDLSIGRLLVTLKMNSLDKNTLVVFASDHGFNAGHHGLWGKGNAAYPLNMFETSLKIPMIWRHSGVIKPGVEESVVQVLDVAPTLLAYAGNYSLPSRNNIPGESFADLLLDPSKRNSRTDRTIYGEYGQTRFARLNGTTKYITRLTGHTELYDLVTDRNETDNLLRPFSTTAARYDDDAANYERALRKWFSNYEDPYVSGWLQPVTGTGQERALYYNSSGWPNTPAFRRLWAPSQSEEACEQDCPD